MLLLTSWAPAATGGPSSDPLTDDLALASLSEEGIKGNDHSRSVRLTADGSMVVFHSFASNLHPDDTDTIGDIYRKAVETGQLVLASTSDDGTKGNGTSLDPTVSSDGGMVAFWSLATNLDPADDDATADSYVKDLATGDTILASTSDLGVKGNSISPGPEISNDGTKVVFYSYSTNLDPLDRDAIPDIYVKDLATGDISLVSTSEEGIKGNGSSYDPRLSADGTRVAFWSFATNLDPADTDVESDVYVKDLVTGDVILASTSDDGVKGNDASYAGVLSSNGRQVGFESYATNLDPNDPDIKADVYFKDLETGALTLVSTSDDGVKGNDTSLHPAVSGDGARVAFYSLATNLDPADGDTIADVYVKDLVTGDLALASTADDGTKGDGFTTNPDLTPEGTAVAFESNAANLDPGDVDRFSDVYLKRLGAAAVATSGHAHTDYSGDGQAGKDDVHVQTTVADADPGDPIPPTGMVVYQDLRDDPPGDPAEAFSCRGRPLAAVALGPNSVRIDGTVRCRGLAQARSFSLVLTDGGPNPPNPDRYRAILLDERGARIYAWTDLTTVDLGDLTVGIGQAPSGA